MFCFYALPNLYNEISLFLQVDFSFVNNSHMEIPIQYFKISDVFEA